MVYPLLPHFYKGIQEYTYFFLIFDANIELSRRGGSNVYTPINVLSINVEDIKLLPMKFSIFNAVFVFVYFMGKFS